MQTSNWLYWLDTRWYQDPKFWLPAQCVTLPATVKFKQITNNQGLIKGPVCKIPDCWDPFPTHQVSKFWVSHVAEAGSGTQQSNILQISTLRRIFTSQETNLNILIQFVLIFLSREASGWPNGACWCIGPHSEQHQGFQSQDPFIRSENCIYGQHLMKSVSALTDWDWPATPSHVKKWRITWKDELRKLLDQQKRQM